MKILEYGRWTIAHNVKNIDKDYVWVYKGHLTPGVLDLEYLGGPVYHISNGKTTNKYSSKYSCPDYLAQPDSITWADDFTTSTSITGNYSAKIINQKPALTAKYLDIAFL